MGAMKDYAIKISYELGYDGELNEKVLRAAQLRLEQRRQELLEEQQDGERKCNKD